MKAYSKVGLRKATEARSISIRVLAACLLLASCGLIPAMSQDSPPKPNQAEQGKRGPVARSPLGITVLGARLLDKRDYLATPSDSDWRFLLIWVELQPTASQRPLLSKDITLTDDAGERYAPSGMDCEVPITEAPSFILFSDMAARGPSPRGKKNRGWWGNFYRESKEDPFWKFPMEVGGLVCAFEGEIKKTILLLSKEKELGAGYVTLLLKDYAVTRKKAGVVFLFMVMAKASSFELQVESGPKLAVPLNIAPASGSGGR